MNIAGITLNAVCLGFLCFLLFLYFSKKNMNNKENKVYRLLLLDDLGLIVAELSFLFLSYFTPKNLFLIGLVKRFNFLFINLFFVLITVYVVIICIENSEKAQAFFTKHSRNTLKVVLFAIFVIAILQFSLPIVYVYDESGIILYAAGFCTNDFAGVVAGFAIVVIFSFLIANWKKVDKKKLSPFLLVCVLEIITVVVVNIEPSLCMAAFSMTMTSYLMFFTIENPDIKMISELTLAKVQAEKSNNAKSDFLSSMSHEIRTPLNAIVGLSQMIQISNDIDDIHEDTNDIIMASLNLLELVNGILDVNKLESNQMEIIETKYNPLVAFNELVKPIEMRLGNKPIELRTNFSENLPEELYGDREKLKQILTNLLTNAAKYTDEGVIDFNVDCEIKSNKCLLKISVSDTGRGIKEDQKEYLFTKFYRLDEDKDSDISGTGLGLAVTKSLVELFDGEITVDSKYGEGSTFTVELAQTIVEKEEKDDKEVTSKVQEANVVEEKVEETNTPVSTTMPTQEVTPAPVVSQTVEQASTPTPVVSEQSAPVEVDPNKPRVLMVVDDNKLNLRVASKLLSEFNFEIETANSGAECLEKVKQDNKYDLIFMDIMMPDMNGIETMHKLKEMDGFTIPVIALTADAMEGSREKYMNEGFDEYVSKPIDKEVIGETIGKYIEVKSN